MAGQTMWLVVIVLVIAAAVIGFYLGRVSAGGARQKTVELEAEIERQKSELNDYRREVDAHFDQTASLFVSMAGSYKALFEHLNGGYEKLAGGEGRDLFRERIASLLLDGRQDEQARYLIEREETAAAEAENEPVGAAAPADSGADANADELQAAGVGAEHPDSVREESAAADTVASEREHPEMASDAVEEQAQPIAATPSDDDREAIKAAAAAAAVSPESADGDAAAVRDESGVPVQQDAPAQVAEDTREVETARS